MHSALYGLSLNYLTAFNENWVCFFHKKDEYSTGLLFAF